MLSIVAPLEPTQFAQRLLRWFDQHGRKQLPWQENNDPYRIWVSEIMLQQTQVTTVIPYYQRFIARFPDIQSLADAPLDEVLHHWSGLGYYARARNLHKAAGIMRNQYKNLFPLDFAQVNALPGVGRSTAGAVLALAQNQRHPILDGNVKRVLSRFAAIEGWPGQAHIAEKLWHIADYYTPKKRVAHYTQAIMDLGAMVCTRSKPKCSSCPLQSHCQAHAQGQTSAYPSPKPHKDLPIKTTLMLLIRDRKGQVLLEKRPPHGIWGGLWSLPECANKNYANIDQWCQTKFAINVQVIKQWPQKRHSFSHFHLDFTPIELQVTSTKHSTIMEAQRYVWYNAVKKQNATTNAIGLAAPISSLLQSLNQS